MAAKLNDKDLAMRTLLTGGKIDLYRLSPVLRAEMLREAFREGKSGNVAQLNNWPQGGRPQRIERPLSEDKGGLLAPSEPSDTTISWLIVLAEYQDPLSGDKINLYLSEWWGLWVGRRSATTLMNAIRGFELTELDIDSKELLKLAEIPELIRKALEALAKVVEHRVGEAKRALEREQKSAERFQAVVARINLRS